MVSVTQTDYHVIINELKNLYKIQEKIAIINDSRIKKMNDFQIGERTSKFTLQNYIEVYRDMFLQKKYHLILYDDSIIDFYYEFDDQGKIIRHSLSFIPGIDYETQEYGKLTSEEYLMVHEIAKYYTRIDYDLTGKKPILHTDVHLHIGLHDRNDDDVIKELRIPLESILYPYEFLYIIFKYYYHVEDSDLECLSGSNYNKIYLLDEFEMDKLVLAFNRIK